MVQVGSLDTSKVLDGVVVRSEKVIYGEETGTAQYVVAEGEKVKKDGAVYVLVDEKQVASTTSQIEEVEKQLYNKAENSAATATNQAEKYNLALEVKNNFEDYYNNCFDSQTNYVYALRSKLDSIVSSRTDLYLQQLKDKNDSLYKYMAYDTTWKNINDDLLDTYGGELQIRYEGDIKYLDYLTEIGEVKETEIRLGKNIKDISEDKDPTSYITRLYPLGCKLKTKDTEGNEIDSEERLTIRTANGGVDYIDDTEAIAEFGIIEGYVTWDEVTEASNLLRKGQEYLKSQRITISNKITALDLSLIGLDIDTFEVGNYHPLKHELLDIDYTIRIIEKTISIENPQASTLTFGDKQADIKQYQLDIKKQANKTVALENEISSQNAKLNSVNKSIIETNKSVEEVSKSVETVGEEVVNLGSNTTETITNMLESIRLLSESVSTINATLNKVNTSISTINNNISTINKNITTVQGDISKLDTKVETIDATIKDIDERVKKLEGETA